MKKILAFVLALMLVLSTSVVAFAAVTNNGGSENGNVEVDIKQDDPDREGEDPSDVDPEEAIYSVTIDVANAIFTYTIHDLDTFDTDTHAYTDGEWDATTGKHIDVINDSNTGISVSADFTAAGAKKNNVTASLSNQTFDLESAAKTGTSNKGEIGVSIDGKAPSIATAYTLAQVTVTIAGK